jgi:CheY-like chemotaxis protein
MNVELHRRVLVVDDDPLIRQMLVSVLRQRHLVVDEAKDGEEAVAHLRENRYAVILLDLLMPIADGFSVLTAMDEDGLHAPPVVLVITGAEGVVVDQLDPRRIHGVIRKPFDPIEIATIVAACAEIRGRNSFETIAVTVIAGAPILAWLGKW